MQQQRKKTKQKTMKKRELKTLERKNETKKGKKKKKDCQLRQSFHSIGIREIILLLPF